MTIREESLEAHKKWGGKIEVISRVEINDRHDLSVAYTPGVAEPCLAIEKDPELSWSLTRRSTSKQRGAEISSRLIPPNEPEIR